MTEPNLRRVALFFVAFGVGALLGDAFIHLIPEAFGKNALGAPLSQSLRVLGGILLFFVVEKLIRHGHEEPHVHHRILKIERPELATVNLVGDAVHNFIDGLVIGGSYITSMKLGVSTTLAVLLHEIPHELGDFGILIHSGLSVRNAALLNLVSASVAILGTATALVIGTRAHEAAAQTLLPLTAGGFVYLAAADLIPELQRDKSVRALVVQTSLIAAGIAVMGALVWLG